MAVERAYAELISEGGSTDGDTLVATAFGDQDFYQVAERYITALKAKGTKDRYRAIIKKLKVVAPTLTSKQLTVDLIERYVNHYSKSSYRFSVPNLQSTISANLSAIKAIINSSKMLRKNNPFDDYSIPTQKAGKKEHVTREEIESMWNYEPIGRWDTLTRDTFLFAFYAQKSAGVFINIV